MANSNHDSSVEVVPLFSWQYSTPLSLYLYPPHLANPSHQPVSTLDVDKQAETSNFSSPSDGKS